jgi:hypothetical protein
MTLTKDFLRYVAEFEQNPQYREMAKELLALRLLNEMQEEIKKQEEEELYHESGYSSMCDDCDMTAPCCNLCIGA